MVDKFNTTEKIKENRKSKLHSKTSGEDVNLHSKTSGEDPLDDLAGPPRFISFNDRFKYKEQLKLLEKFSKNFQTENFEKNSKSPEIQVVRTIDVEGVQNMISTKVNGKLHSKRVEKM
jgi:hypothetical protein